MMIEQGSNPSGKPRTDSFKLPATADGQAQISRNLSDSYYWALFILIGNGL
ncbi:MAG: hypothetical protein KME16_14495 [Scytolyngbya sp. HA4215-MV1]|nr:hypothetical protein [Scytolyngbya sp. HA4215-MV1]